MLINSQKEVIVRRLKESVTTLMISQWHAHHRPKLQIWGVNWRRHGNMFCGLPFHSHGKIYVQLLFFSMKFWWIQSMWNGDCRFFVATWNVGGKSPSHGLNLEDFLQVESASDIYILGYVINSSLIPILSWTLLIPYAYNPIKILNLKGNHNQIG